ncbi:MAG: TIGR03915 family putative DNA repair protein [Candidatus Margulisbacteria bacterium]|jgi:probable DNA metabolism protein|nr:TIGR03915 family putative DNA repair protein [Candidatus Margulisiibacteriota bacterium]
MTGLPGGDAVFLYDGSLEGLLTCVFEAYRLKILPEIASADNYCKSLFAAEQYIATDTVKAERVCAGLKKLGGAVFSTVQYCYLSGEPRKEKIIFAYIRHTLSAGRDLNGNYADPVISAALACLQKVTREAERLKGLLRLQELKDGSFYGAVEPEHCVLPLLAGHFRARLGGQSWIIHDARRSMALVCRQGEVRVFSAVDIQNAREQYSAAEPGYQELWKIFFKNIAIQERRNLKLQRHFMPRRYWKYLVEKN